MAQDKQTIVLKGLDVHQISLLPMEQNYRENSRLSGEHYHIGRFRGRGFTCQKDFYNDFKAGKVAQATFTENSYSRMIDDPLNPGTQKSDLVEGWSLDGYLTYEQYNTFLGYQKEVVKGEAQLKIAEHEALKDLKLTEEKVNKLESAM